MSLPRSTSPKSRKSSVVPPKDLWDDPTLVAMGTHSDYPHPDNWKPRQLREFVVTMGANCVDFYSGLNIDLESVIADERVTYQGAIDAFHDEVSDGRRPPTDTIKGMLDADGGVGTIGDYADQVVWQSGGRVAAVLVPTNDGSGLHVTKFSMDRSRPGPLPPKSVAPSPTQAKTGIKAVCEGTAAIITLPPKPGPWRTICVAQQGEIGDVYQGHGMTLEDVVAEETQHIRGDDDPLGGGIVLRTYEIMLYESGELVATIHVEKGSEGEYTLIRHDQAHTQAPSPASPRTGLPIDERLSGFTSHGFTPGTYDEFIATINTSEADRHAGPGVTLDSVIENYQKSYRFSFKDFAEDERSYGPAEFAAEYDNIVVWQGTNVLAVLKADPTGKPELVVTRFDQPVSDQRASTATIPAPAGARVVSIVGCEATIKDLFLDLREIRRYANDDEKPYSDEDQHIYESGQHVAILRTIPEEDRDSEGNLTLIMVEAGKRAPRKPTKPWRSFKVDRPGGGCATIGEGHGTTLDEAIAEAVDAIHAAPGSGLNPSDHVIIEQDRVICRVLAKDVLSERTWNESCDEEDEAIAEAAKARTADALVAEDVDTADPLAPASFSPANLPELVLTLARVELRDAVDALLGARFRVNQAHSGMQRLDGDAKRMAKALDERADNVCTEAEFAIAKSLLSVWGIDDGDVHPIDETPVPWTPCGALVEDRYFVWVVPNEHHGRPDYSIYREVPRVRVIDNEDLEEDGLSDDDWDRLLERPPCRYVVLSGSKPAAVVDPECMTWR